MLEFRQSLIGIRNDEINLRIHEHDTDLRAQLSQVCMGSMRADLYSQAGCLFPSVETIARIPMREFFHRHRVLLRVKKVVSPADFYARYPEITLLLERLRAEFTGMIVTFGVDNDESFVFKVSGVLESPSGETGHSADYSTHVVHYPSQS